MCLACNASAAFLKKALEENAVQAAQAEKTDLIIEAVKCGCEAFEDNDLEAIRNRAMGLRKTGGKCDFQDNLNSDHVKAIVSDLMLFNLDTAIRSEHAFSHPLAVVLDRFVSALVDGNMSIKFICEANLVRNTSSDMVLAFTQGHQCTFIPLVCEIGKDASLVKVCQVVGEANNASKLCHKKFPVFGLALGKDGVRLLVMYWTQKAIKKADDQSLANMRFAQLAFAPWKDGSGWVLVLTVLVALIKKGAIKKGFIPSDIPADASLKYCKAKLLVADKVVESGWPLPDWCVATLSPNVFKTQDDRVVKIFDYKRFCVNDRKLANYVIADNEKRWINIDLAKIIYQDRPDWLNHLEVWKISDDVAWFVMPFFEGKSWPSHSRDFIPLWQQLCWAFSEGYLLADIRRMNMVFNGENSVLIGVLFLV